MKFDKELNEIYILVNTDEYKKTLLRIKKLRFRGCNDVVLFLYEALCAYEAGDDLECLRLLSIFLNTAEHHQKREYALFTVGICLMNLGLVGEAKKVFIQISDKYPNILKERENAENEILSRQKALEIYTNIME